MQLVGDYALFVYSMGSISLVEVFRQIIREVTIPYACIPFVDGFYR